MGRCVKDWPDEDPETEAFAVRDSVFSLPLGP